MFGIGGFELFIILIFGFLIFGPDKLPDIAKTVGKGIARFREAQKEVNDAIGDEKIIDLDNPDEPFKNPVEALDRIAKRQEEKRAAAKGEATPAVKQDAGAVGNQEAQGEPSSDGEPKQESFTERKARYERERAARKAAEAEAAKAAGEGGSAESAQAEVAQAQVAQAADQDSEPVSADAQPDDASAGSAEGGDA